jgi:hypothetical protein
MSNRAALHARDHDDLSKSAVRLVDHKVLPGQKVSQPTEGFHLMNLSQGTPKDSAAISYTFAYKVATRVHAVAYITRAVTTRATLSLAPHNVLARDFPKECAAEYHETMSTPSMLSTLGSLPQ